jgi:TolB protein
MIGALLFAAAALAPVPPSDSCPQLSPDGRRLVFQSNRTGRPALWIAGADGDAPRMLFDGGALGGAPASPAWSPDARAIVLALRPAGAADPEESDIYVMAADGSRVRRLTETTGDDSHPHWSGDGSRIFFNSARATPDPRAEWSRQWIDIYSMAPDGTNIRRHSDCRSICTYPWPSPDGKWLAFRRVIDGPGRDWALQPVTRNSEIFVARIDGSEARNLSRNTAYDGWPTWSPDSRWIVFASNRAGAPRAAQLYAVRPDGTALTALTEGPWSRVQASFAPGGRELLAYESHESETLEQGHVASIAIDLPQP